MLYKFVFMLFSAAVVGIVLFECIYWGHVGKLIVQRKPVPRFCYRRSVLGLHGVVLGLIGCFLYGWLVEPYRLEVTHHEVVSKKWAGGRLRIVQFSDLHCDYRERLEDELVEAVNALDADLVVFTGDGTNPPHGLDRFRKTLKGMRAKYGKYAVRGNWDGGEAHLFDSTGFMEVDGRTIEIEAEGGRLALTGLSFANTGNVWRYLHGVSKEDFSLFLYHTPDLIGYLNDLPVDLYLCGHTHGGQVCLPGYGAILTFSRYGKLYESGLYRVGQVEMYVNRGIGMEGGYAPRIRFWCRPELAVFDLRGE